MGAVPAPGAPSRPQLTNAAGHIISAPTDRKRGQNHQAAGFGGAPAAPWRDGCPRNCRVSADYARTDEPGPRQGGQLQYFAAPGRRGQVNNARGGRRRRVARTGCAGAYWDTDCPQGAWGGSIRRTHRLAGAASMCARPPPTRAGGAYSGAREVAGDNGQRARFGEPTAYENRHRRRADRLYAAKFHSARAKERHI